MYSIYHFFLSLVQQKHLLKKVEKLDQFPFDKNLLSCKNDGVFPDMAIRLNKDRKIFTGGELIELKDSDFYTVSSFNSTIPSRSKKIEDIITGENSIIEQQMEEAGNNIFSLSVFSKTELKQFSIFKIKHYFNGYFLVLQMPL